MARRAPGTQLGLSSRHDSGTRSPSHKLSGRVYEVSADLTKVMGLRFEVMLIHSAAQFVWYDLAHNGH